MKRFVSLCLKCVLFAGMSVSPVLAQSLQSVDNGSVVSHENQLRAEIPEVARESNVKSAMIVKPGFLISICRP